MYKAYISFKEERIILSKSKKIIEKLFKKYIKKMERLKKKGYCDETAIDIENWYVLKGLIYEYEKDGGISLLSPYKTLEEELTAYFGDIERTELVLSYFTIAKYLIDNGATFNI